jgi:hypothetical protein
MNFLKRLFHCRWERINSLPEWVSKAFHKDFNKNYSRGNRNPYNKVYHYKGKSFIYKIVVTDLVQGGCYSYYKRIRIIK